MPDSGAGVYSLPPGYEAVTGQTIEASQHNPPLEDLANAMTARLPRNGSAPMLAAINMAGSKVINLGTPTDAADAATKAYIDAAIAAVVVQIVTLPPGLVGKYAGNGVPAGWLLCDGSPVSRTTYAALFTAIGTRYGVGDGSTTFNLPEVRGEFDRYTDLGRGVDPGRVVGTAQAQEFQAHTHGVNEAPHVHGPGVPGASFVNVLAGSDFVSTPGGSFTTVGSGTTDARLTNITIQNAGGAETRPRNIAFTGIIKT